jgi:hypothetical protein
MKAMLVGILLGGFASLAGADIVAWVDASGTRHFTNVREEIPDEYRSSAALVVNEQARLKAVPEPAPATSRRPRVISDWNGDEPIDGGAGGAAYADCRRRACERDAFTGAGGGGGGGGATLQINGPLAIATAPEAAYGGTALPYAPWLYGYLAPQWYPFVTTSFDRGRSRHLTLRMLLQDQFQLDREAPYVYVERLPPFGVAPLGPNLNAFLPRGLPPYSVPVTTRLITR